LRNFDVRRDGRLDLELAHGAMQMQTAAGHWSRKMSK
jgi:hypothetical protein